MGPATLPRGPPLPLTSTVALAIEPPEPKSSFLVWVPPAPVPPRPPRQAPRVSCRALLGVRLPAGLVGAGLCSGPSGGVRPFPASCSGSFGGGRPPSFFQSVVLRAFSPRSPCFRLGKVRETLSSVVTSEPFGLNSKCGRQRPWGARGALHVGTVGAWGTAWAAC